MKLTESQRARLQELIYESYLEELPEAEWESHRQALLARISDPFELHVFAMNVNWDVGTKDLEWVLNHEECDLGTALMIYAHGSPGYYYRKQEKGEQFHDYETDAWKFLKSIEQRVSDGAFKQGTVAFDPRNPNGDDHYRVNSANPGNRLVPETMKRSTHGDSIENPTI
jgi:Domain of unknown function (DUF4274)